MKLEVYVLAFNFRQKITSSEIINGHQKDTLWPIIFNKNWKEIVHKYDRKSTKIDFR